MAAEEEMRTETTAASDQEQELPPPSDVPQEKSLVPFHGDKSLPSDERNFSNPSLSWTNTETVVAVSAAPAEEKYSGGSLERDAMLAHVEHEKKMALIKAWEDNEKSKAENKAYKKLCAIESWENTKRAYVEAQLKKMEEKLEKQKANYAEKMKNKMAEIHKAAEEKRAMTEARRGEDILKAEEEAAKYRATGSTPKKFIGFCGCLS